MQGKFFSGLLASVAFSTLLTTGYASAQSSPPVTAEQVEGIVRSYLLRNPGLLREVSVALQRQEAAEAQARARQAMETLRAELFNAPGSPVAGNPRGDVTVVEFFDFRCSYCKRAAPELEAVLKADPNVRIVYKQLPILGPDSLVAARASLAAHAQGRYEAFHKALFALDHVDEKTVFNTASALGLDMDRLRTDMASDAVTREIEANARMAAPLGVTGTPGFVIGDRVAPGMLDQAVMNQWIAEARSAKK
mgnify:CR=1 FL=1|jgi:protein-disulfide isomerase